MSDRRTLTSDSTAENSVFGAGVVVAIALLIVLFARHPWTAPQSLPGAHTATTHSAHTR